MRLARTLGKAAAHQRVEGWSKRVVAEQRALHEVAAQALATDPALDPSLDADELARLFDADLAARPAVDAANRQFAALRAQWAAATGGGYT